MSAGELNILRASSAPRKAPTMDSTASTVVKARVASRMILRMPLTLDLAEPGAHRDGEGCGTERTGS